MHKVQISFIPTAEPEGEVIPEALNAKNMFWEYVIARYNKNSKRYQYENKVILTKKGANLQILSKDPATGRITKAFPQNAFDLSIQPLKVTLLDSKGDGSEYKVRIEAGKIPDAKNRIALSHLYNPQMQIAEVTLLQDANKLKELSLIGVDDIRIGLSARMVKRPNETFEMSYNDGKVAFAY